MEIKSLKNSEKSARLHLVENKISICKELEKKECQTKKFENIINDLQMENQILNGKNFININYFKNYFYSKIKYLNKNLIY